MNWLPSDVSSQSYREPIKMTYRGKDQGFPLKIQRGGAQLLSLPLLLKQGQSWSAQRTTRATRLVLTSTPST